jgi:CheY-like chemotaxis protein
MTAEKIVLVVEDDWVIRDTLQELLSNEGYRVVTAENGREGLDALRDIGPVAAVLLDLQMPVMNGEKFLDELEVDPDPRLRAVPVLVLTARREGLDRPVAGLLRKPVNVDVLLERLRTLIEVGAAPAGTSTDALVERTTDTAGERTAEGVNP